jgi:hypothetical protein
LKYGIISQPFDKFYNLGEENETSYENLIKKKELICLEKLDGTMCSIFWHEFLNEWIVSTRGVFDNEYSIFASDQFLNTLGNKELSKKYTLIFEIIAPQFRNIIDYGKKGYVPGIYLLAIRNRRNDIIYPFVGSFHHGLGIPEEIIIDKFLNTFKSPGIYPFPNLDAVIENVKTLSFTEEGYVLWFEDRTLVKIKSTEYLKAHKFLWDYSDDRVLELFEKGDEKILKEHLSNIPEEYEKEVLRVMYQAKKSEIEVIRKSYQWFAEAPKTSRKEFALWIQKNVPKEYLGFLFRVMDGKPISTNEIYHSFRNGAIEWRE